MTAGLAAALVTITSLAARAQTAAATGAPVVAWSPDGSMDGGGDLGNPLPVRAVYRGDRVRGLPIAARQLAVSYAWQGGTWSLDDYMRAYKVSGVMVLKDGEVVLERYAQGRQPTDRWASQSVAKSVTSVLFGAAVQGGRIQLSDTVETYVPELKGSAYAKVTVRQLLTMSSGVAWKEGYVGADSDLARFYKAGAGGGDALSYLAGLPRAAPQGTRFNYNTAETHLAGVVLARAAGMPLADYLSEKVWKPAGMERDGAWRVDPKGHELAGCCLIATLSDFARLGQFVLEDGVAGGERVTAPGWIAESTRRQIGNGRPAPFGYGYFWWIGPESFEASGIYGQSIQIWPKEKVVIVVNSQWPDPGDDTLNAALAAFHEGVIAAVRAQYPGR